MSISRSLLALVAVAALSACAGDAVSPAAAPAPRAPSLLLGADEGMRVLSDSTDAYGNTIMVAEYAAGVYATPGTAPVASVTIRTFIPALSSGSSSEPCITSTIDKIETTTGWTASVKKPGGCDKEIVVGLENRSRNQKAQFSFLYIFGKTRIDSGLIR
jgi:hypothetical protein